jgi:hypothetical protein
MTKTIFTMGTITISSGLYYNKHLLLLQLHCLYILSHKLLLLMFSILDYRNSQYSASKVTVISILHLVMFNSIPITICYSLLIHSLSHSCTFSMDIFLQTKSRVYSQVLQTDRFHLFRNSPLRLQHAVNSAPIFLVHR